MFNMVEPTYPGSSPDMGARIFLDLFFQDLTRSILLVVGDLPVSEMLVVTSINLEDLFAPSLEVGWRKSRGRTNGRRKTSSVYLFF